MSVKNPDLRPDDYKEYANEEYWDKRYNHGIFLILDIRSLQTMILSGTMIIKLWRVSLMIMLTQQHEYPYSVGYWLNSLIVCVSCRMW